MDLQAEKNALIEYINQIKEISVLNKFKELAKANEEKDNILRKKLTARALKANEDIQSGRVFNREELEKRLNNSLGI